MGNQEIANYYISNKKYYIYGCWDKETPENQFDFYDVYDEKGICLNEGNPFWEFPSWQDMVDFVDTL